RRGSADNERDDDAIDAIADSTPAADERQAVRDVAARALAALPPRERALLWLAHGERYEHRENAAILGLRPPTVRVLLHPARKKALLALGGIQEERGDRHE